MAQRKFRLPGFIRESKKRTGLPAGTLIFIGEHLEANPRLELIQYDEQGFRQQEFSEAEQCLNALAEDKVNWINVIGLQQVNNVHSIGKHLGLHPLLQEDILDTEQAPKFESDATGHLFLILKMFTLDREHRSKVDLEQLSLVQKNNLVVTFQERGDDVFAPLRRRLQKEGTRIRKDDGEYLAYAIIDTLSDSFFQTIDVIAETIEQMEVQLLTRRADFKVDKIYSLKVELIYVKRAVAPLGRIVKELEASEHFFIDRNDDFYIRDVGDNVAQVVDRVNTYREVLTGLAELFHSTANEKMNRVINTLTVFSTIFLPLTFLTGLYGMNFKYMPELDEPYAYPILLGLMGMIAAGMLIFFRMKRWL